MEEGLGFALHRLLDLKQMHYEYLNNPYYSTMTGTEVQDFCAEAPKSIHSDVQSLIDKLLQQE